MHRQLHGLFLNFIRYPAPRGLNVADNGLATLVNVNVLDRHLLLAFATMAVKRLKQSRVGARELICLV